MLKYIPLSIAIIIGASLITCKNAANGQVLVPVKPTTVVSPNNSATQMALEMHRIAYADQITVLNRHYIDHLRSLLEKAKEDKNCPPETIADMEKELATYGPQVPEKPTLPSQRVVTPIEAARNPAAAAKPMQVGAAPPPWHEGIWVFKSTSAPNAKPIAYQVTDSTFGVYYLDRGSADNRNLVGYQKDGSKIVATMFGNLYTIEKFGHNRVKMTIKMKGRTSGNGETLYGDRKE